ncbi:MAG TPA: hypothetical protein VGE01_04300 [Fimbriimonas sp.]
MKFVKKTWGFEAGIVLLAVFLAWTFGGGLAARGLTLGVATVGFSVLASWGMIRLLRYSEPTSQSGAKTAILLFLLKAPILGAGVVYANSLGTLAMNWFLAGVGLVYCDLVFRVSLDARRQDPGT